jgi:3-hydroxyisobutyrate dehydrogenase
MYFIRKYSTVKLGFIGLGKMGTPMSLNLLNNCKDLTVFDQNAETRTFFEDKANVASNLADFKNCDYVFTMLPDSASTMDVLFSSNGLLNSLNKGATIINSGTIGISACYEIVDKIGKNFDFLDAPVSGGTMGAEKGTLTFMVGGNNNSYQKAKPLLTHMGENIIYLGEVGTGQAAKLCNNMLLAINMIGASEAFALAKNLGLDLKIFNDLVSVSSGKSWVTDFNNPVPGVSKSSPASKNYKGGFSSQLLLKDTDLALKACHEKGMKLMALETSYNYLLQMIKQDEGSGAKDMSYIFQHILSQKYNKP